MLSWRKVSPRLLNPYSTQLSLLEALPLQARPCYVRVMTMQFQKIDPRVTITTPFGEIKIRFYPDDAPRHVENFIKLAKMGFYNGTTFHRVVPGFIIQGGDPLSKTPTVPCTGLAVPATG